MNKLVLFQNLIAHLKDKMIFIEYHLPAGVKADEASLLCKTKQKETNIKNNGCRLISSILFIATIYMNAYLLIDFPIFNNHLKAKRKVAFPP